MQFGQPFKMTRAEAAAAIASSSRRFIAGQTIEYTDPLAGGSQGLRCIIGGAGGGTAVFKESGVIAV